MRIGVVMGMASAVYFATNAYIPDFLDQSGRHHLIAPTLAVLNGSQLLTAPGGGAVGAVAHRPRRVPRLGRARWRWRRSAWC